MHSQYSCLSSCLHTFCCLNLLNFVLSQKGGAPFLYNLTFQDPKPVHKYFVHVLLQQWHNWGRGRQGGLGLGNRSNGPWHWLVGGGSSYCWELWVPDHDPSSKQKLLVLLCPRHPISSLCWCFASFPYFLQRQAAWGVYRKATATSYQIPVNLYLTQS